MKYFCGMSDAATLELRHLRQRDFCSLHAAATVPRRRRSVSWTLALVERVKEIGSKKVGYIRLAIDVVSLGPIRS